MTHHMYWLDVNGDRTGCDVLVNGIPAEHLLGAHGIHMPINEYLRAGASTIEVRRGPWPSNKPDDVAGTVTVKVVKARFDGASRSSEAVILQQDSSYERCVPGQILLTATLPGDLPGLSVADDYEPVGPAQRALILDRLAAVQAAWQSGDADALVEWMRPYLADYVAAYPLETIADMEERVRRMAAGFRGGRATFDRARTRLQPIAGTHLVDCLSQAGAAVRIERADGPDYDMWAVVGCRGGRVELVR